MHLLLGRLLNSLSFQVEKNLKETVYSSDTFNAHKWNLWEKQIIQWSKAPLVNVVKIFFLTGLIAFGGWLIENQFSLLESGDLYQWKWLYPWQPTILSSQLTLIGVVFPLVIGFVSFLLQSATASKSIWELYRHYSGFIFTGFSGLGLSIFILSGYYIETFLPMVSYSLWCVVSTAWMIANIILSGWFLWSTFQIIHEPSRDKLILRYTINESFIYSIRKRLSQLIPENSVDRGLIGDLNEEHIEVKNFSFSHTNENKTLVSKSFNKESYVSDVFFRIQKIALSITSSRHNKKKPSDKVQLELPLSVDQIARKEQIIVTISGQPLTLLERLLFKASYCFSKQKPFEEDILDDIIFALIGSVIDNFKDNKPKLFEESLKRLVEWHAAVTDALSFTNDNGFIDNWLMLPASSFWHRTYLNQLLREYYLLSQLTVSKISESPEYFEDIVNLHIRMHNRSKSELPSLLVKELIDGHHLTWVALTQHWDKESMPTGSTNADKYENAIITYAGSWEQWPMFVASRSEPWDQNFKAIPVLLHYLTCTGLKLITTARNDDEIASKWAVDMLLYWYRNVSNYQHPNQKYLWKHEIITPQLLEEQPLGQTWKEILSGHNFEASSAALIALENSWKDIRLIAASYISSKPNSKNYPLLQSLTSNLLSGDFFKPSNDMDIQRGGISSGKDILTAFIRQKFSSRLGADGYSGWLNSIIERFNRNEEPKHVMGRVYSGWGAHGIESLNEQYVALSVMLSEQEWQLPNRWYEIIDSELFNQKSREVLISDLQNWLQIADAQLADNEANTNNFKCSIESVITKLSDKNLDDIRNSEIDVDQLDLLGQAASISGFNPDKGGMLLKLFKSIEYDLQPNDSSLYMLRINGYSKSSIAKGIDASKPINEEEWLDRAIAKNISLNLFNKLSSIKNTIESSFENTKDLLNRIAVDIRENAPNHAPMSLFIGPWEIHRFLSEASYNVTSNPGLNLELQHGFENTYICHLEGIPVYQLPYQQAAFSLLVPNKVFDTVQVTEITDNRFVDVTTEDLDDETQRLTLVLSYHMEAKFKEEPIYRYTLKKHKNA